MARMIRTSHTKNSTMPGRASPAMVLVLATSAQLPVGARPNRHPLGEPSRPASPAHARSDGIVSGGASTRKAMHSDRSLATAGAW